MMGTLLFSTSHLSRFEVGVDQLISQTVQFLPFPPSYFNNKDHFHSFDHSSIVQGDTEYTRKHGWKCDGDAKWD